MCLRFSWNKAIASRFGIQTMKWTIQLNVFLGICALALMPIGILGSSLGIWNYRIAQLACVTAVIAGLSTLALALLLRTFCDREYTKKLTQLSAILALPPLIIAGWFMFSNRDAVMIHQITTDLESPPEYLSLIEARGTDSNPLAYTAQNKRLQQQHFPDVGPIYTRLSVPEAKWTAKRVIQSLGWVLYDDSSRANYLEATETTLLFRYVDDIVIRLHAENGQTRIDLRSTSRVGRSDLGVNAARISRFTSEFEKRVASL